VPDWGQNFFGSDIIGTVLKIVRRAITVMIACPFIDNRIVEGANHDVFGRACKGAHILALQKRGP
jgi:hypothetical protein